MTRRSVRTRWARAGVWLTAAVLCIAAPASAEVRVTDAGGGVLVIEARDASVQDILVELGKSHPTICGSSQALSRRVSGMYRGTLARVLSRLLGGYDHVIRSGPAGIELDIVDAGQPGRSRASSAAPAVRVPATRDIAADVSHTVNLSAAPQPSPPPIRPSRGTLFGNALRAPATTSP